MASGTIDRSIKKDETTNHPARPAPATLGNGKKIKRQKNRRLRERRSKSRGSLFLPPDVFASQSLAPEEYHAHGFPSPAFGRNQSFCNSETINSLITLARCAAGQFIDRRVHGRLPRTIRKRGRLGQSDHVAAI